MSLLREDGTLLLHADQLVRDSNQDLRLAFNTSLLPAGRYVLRVEGYGRGGKLERFGEAAGRRNGSHARNTHLGVLRRAQQMARCPRAEHKVPAKRGDTPAIPGDASTAWFVTIDSYLPKFR